MATANYVLLQRITTTTSVASVTFSGIPQTGYTDLKIVMSGRTTGTDSPVKIEFNGVTTGYSWRRIYGDGTAASSQAASADAYSLHVDTSSKTANTFSSSDIYIPNYTSSNQKSFSIETALESNSGSAGAGELFLMAGLSTSTSAITSIALTHLNANLVAGSTFSLYGIADVNTTPKSAPKADGGDIIQTDGTYWYHAFTGSGIFKPQLNLTCDYLIISGGGGGSNSGGIGSGGGAGALYYSTGNALASNSLTFITVGAGGARDNTSSGPGMDGSSSSIGGISVSVANGARGNYASGNSNAGDGGISKNVISGTTTNYTGGTGSGVDPNRRGGGGAGAGANGIGGGGGAGSMTGGAGLNTYSSWATATGTGASGYYAGGGGGGYEVSGGASQAAGGAGGGGQGGAGTTAPAYNADNGVFATGGGGGGAGGKSGVVGGTSGNGGSGIIIIRYAV
jgi:hypothetical protein